MAAGADYIFALQTKDYKFWQFDTRGTPYKGGNPYFLEFAPVGWSELTVQNLRNKRYWAIDRTVSAPLSYVEDGAKILKHIFTTLGIEESVYLVIAHQQLDYTPGVSYGYWYKQIFRAEIDLSTYQHVGSKVTCTTLEDGLAKYLKSNENTVYEFPMDVPEAVTVRLDGITLHEKLIYDILSDLEIERATYGQSFRLPIPFITNEGDSVGIYHTTQNLETTAGATWADRLAKQNFLVKNVGNHPVSLNLSGALSFRVVLSNSPSHFIRFRFVRSNQLQSNQDDYLVYSSPSLTTGLTFTVPFTKVISIDPGESLFLEANYGGGSSANCILSFNPSAELTITFLTRADPTTHKAFRPQYLFQQLISKVTEGTYSAAISNFFTANKNILITSGNAIRRLSDATLKTSFSDFFQWWDCFSSVGISEVGKTVGFDEKINLIDTASFIDLPEVASGTMKISVAKEFLFNELNIGYPEFNNDVGVLNGNEEYNDKMIFSLGVSKSPALLDKVAKYNASPYDIEKTRVSTFEKTTTDYKNDNKVYLLHVEDAERPEGWHLLDRALNPGTTGLIEPDSVYNLFLSPKRNLIRNGAYIRSALYLSDTRTLAFISADKNNKVVSNGIVEAANVNIGSLAGKFFVPVLFDFNVKVPDNLLELLDINPLRLFRFPFNGDTYTGILQKVSISPATRNDQAYQLLSTAANNLTKLIEYYG